MSKNTKKLKSNFSKPTATTAAVQATSVQPTTAPIQPTASPSQTKPNRVLLEYVKPEAKAVYVAGSFNNWKPEQTPLAPTGNGHWVGDLAVAPGRHEYLFVVDGQWLPDPNARELVPNPYGGKNSVLVVSS